MNLGRTLTFVRKNIRRTPYQAFAASMVMFLTFLVLSIFAILGFGSQKILTYYEQKPQAIAFFKDNTSTTDVDAIKTALTTTGKVTNLKFVSKDEALQIYKDRNKNQPLLLELVTANILPASLEISTANPEDLGPIVEIIKKEPVIEEVVYPEDVVQTLSKAANLIRVVGLSAVGFLLTFSLLAILMIIGFKIRVGRDEIETMKLLGASKWFIRAPYLFEGIFYGIFGVAIAWTSSYIIMWYLTPFLQSKLGDLQVLPIAIGPMLLLLATELIIAVIIGGFGSYLAVRRYLRL